MLLNASSTSIGSIQTVVLDSSEDRSLIECSVLRCKAPGVPESIFAAFDRLSAAWTSPSDWMTTALLSLSAFFMGIHAFTVSRVLYEMTYNYLLIYKINGIAVIAFLLRP